MCQDYPFRKVSNLYPAGESKHKILHTIQEKLSKITFKEGDGIYWSSSRLNGRVIETWLRFLRRFSASFIFPYFAPSNIVNDGRILFP